MITSAYRPAPGRFLISEPFMADDNFQRTVIFLVEHGEEGSLGFVLNRQLGVQLSEIIEGFPYTEAPVFTGGPVEQNTLHYVHRLGDVLEGSREIFDGVYWGGRFDDLKTYASEGNPLEQDVLFFVGYSGWGPDQLEGELERKSWIVAPQNEDFVFRNDYFDLWRDLLKNMGDKYHIIANYPVDPRLN